MKTIRWYITALFLLCCSCAMPSKPFPLETIEAIKHSVVPVVCMVEDKGSYSIAEIVGSAFFINRDGHFFTAAHAVNNWDELIKRKGNCFPAIYIPQKEWANSNLTDLEWFSFASCEKEIDIDIAVCKTTVNPFLKQSTMSHISPVTFTTFNKLNDGTQLAFTGFPLRFIRPVTSIGHLATYFKEGNLLIIDKGNWPGASGSLIYLPNADVVGVLIQRGINEGTGLTYARSSQTIVDFLTKHKIKFSQKQINE